MDVNIYSILLLYSLCEIVTSQIDDYNYLGSHFVANGPQYSGGLTHAVSIGGLNFPSPPSPRPIADNLVSRHGRSRIPRRRTPYKLPEADIVSLDGDSLPSIIAVDPKDFNLDESQLESSNTPLYELRPVSKKRAGNLEHNAAVKQNSEEETTYVVLEPVNFRPESVPQAQPLRRQRPDSENIHAKHIHAKRQSNSNRRFSSNVRSLSQNREEDPLIPFILPPTVTRRTSNKVLQNDPGRPIYALVSGDELGQVLSTTQFLNAPSVTEHLPFRDAPRTPRTSTAVQADNLLQASASKTWNWDDKEPNIQISSKLETFKRNLEKSRREKERIKSNALRQKLSQSFHEDQHDQCCSWSFQNECVQNPSWMLVHCPTSCGVKKCTYSNWHQCGVPDPPRKCRPFNYSLKTTQFTERSQFDGKIREPSTRYNQPVPDHHFTAPPEPSVQTRQRQVAAYRNSPAVQSSENIIRLTQPNYAAKTPHLPDHRIPQSVTPFPDPSVPAYPAASIAQPQQVQSYYTPTPQPPIETVTQPPYYPNPAQLSQYNPAQIVSPTAQVNPASLGALPQHYIQQLSQLGQQLPSVSGLPQHIGAQIEQTRRQTSVAGLPTQASPGYLAAAHQYAYQQYLQGQSKVPPSIVIPIPVPVPVASNGQSALPPISAPAPPPESSSFDSGEESIRDRNYDKRRKSAPSPPPNSSEPLDDDLTNGQLLKVLKQLFKQVDKSSNQRETKPGSALESLLAKLALERRNELPQLLQDPIERLMVNLVTVDSLQQRSTMIDQFLDNYDIL